MAKKIKLALFALWCKVQWLILTFIHEASELMNWNNVYLGITRRNKPQKYSFVNCHSWNNSTLQKLKCIIDFLCYKSISKMVLIGHFNPSSKWIYSPLHLLTFLESYHNATFSFATIPNFRVHIPHFTGTWRWTRCIKS